MSFVKLVHLFPDVLVDTLVKSQKRAGAGVVAAAVGAFHWLRKDRREPLDVHSFEFVSAVVADEVCHSSKHIAFGFMVYGCQKWRKRMQ